jgi:hypothetical protein
MDITTMSRQTGKIKLLWRQFLEDNNKILIIGYPNSGKTTLFEMLRNIDEKPDRFYLHTDDFKEYEYKEQLYMIIDELDGHDSYIIEGIQGYRLLRKYVELEKAELKPDLIVICESETRTPDPKHDRMCKGLDKIWEDYNDLEKNLPNIIYYIN